MTIACPDCHTPLRDGLACVACGTTFLTHQGVPVLFPAQILPFFHDGFIEIPDEKVAGAAIQYFRLWTLKNNLGKQDQERILPDPKNPWKKQQYDSVRSFVRAKGEVLDVGCGDPAYSMERLGVKQGYLGVDSFFSGVSPHYVMAASEYLPVPDESFDTVTILGVLDHCLDYIKVIDEAWRALRQGGALYISTLVWRDHYDLDRDEVHFHHFKEFEIFGALSSGFDVARLNRFPWKEPFRKVLYLEARRRERAPFKERREQ